MGLGRIARGLGKVGLLIEGVGYVVTAGRALWRAVRGSRSQQADDRGASDGDIARQDGADDIVQSEEAL